MPLSPPAIFTIHAAFTERAAAGREVPASRGGRLWAQPVAVAIATADTAGSKNDAVGCGPVGVFSVTAM